MMAFFGVWAVMNRNPSVRSVAGFLRIADITAYPVGARFFSYARIR
jgi:hypothetical protein